MEPSFLSSFGSVGVFSVFFYILSYAFTTTLTLEAMGEKKAIRIFAKGIFLWPMQAIIFWRKTIMIPIVATIISINYWTNTPLLILVIWFFISILFSGTYFLIKKRNPLM